MTEPPSHPDGPTLQATLDWWQSMQKQSGQRAQLRRAKSLEEIVMTPPFHQLRHALHAVGWDNVNGIAMLAGVLAWIETDVRQRTFGQQLIAKEYKELRFRRLLQTKDREGAYLAMLRISKHLNKTANLAHLIPLLYWWNPRSRRDLAMAYYDATGNTSSNTSTTK